MKRTIIKIDEKKCNGCGLCVSSCHEGALKVINGKAKLIREDFYADDYADSTMKLISDNISYETVKLNYIDLVRSILR